MALNGILAGLGLGTTTTRYLANLGVSDRERCGRVLGLTLGLGSLLAGAIAAALAYIREVVPDEGEREGEREGEEGGKKEGGKKGKEKREDIVVAMICIYLRRYHFSDYS